MNRWLVCNDGKHFTTSPSLFQMEIEFDNFALPGNLDGYVSNTEPSLLNYDHNCNWKLLIKFGVYFAQNKFKMVYSRCWCHLLHELLYLVETILSRTETYLWLTKRRNCALLVRQHWICNHCNCSELVKMHSKSFISVHSICFEH